MTLGARTLLVAPGLTTSNKKLLVAKGIATRSKGFMRMCSFERSPLAPPPKSFGGHQADG